jgi:hypothetical protein
LAMIISQILSGVDDSVHIGLHQVCNNVDVLIAGGSWRLLNVDKPNNVFVVEEF